MTKKFEYILTSLDYVCKQYYETESFDEFLDWFKEQSEVHEIVIYEYGKTTIAELLNLTEGWYFALLTEDQYHLFNERINGIQRPEPIPEDNGLHNQLLALARNMSADEVLCSGTYEDLCVWAENCPDDFGKSEDDKVKVSERFENDLSVFVRDVVDSIADLLMKFHTRALATVPNYKPDIDIDEGLKVKNISVTSEAWNDIQKYLPEPTYRDQVLKEHLYECDIDNWPERDEDAEPIPQYVEDYMREASKDGFSYVRFIFNP